jgi:hypothetical protein
LDTYASPIKSKGGSNEEPAGALGLRFLPLAFSSLGIAAPLNRQLLLRRRRPRWGFGGRHVIEGNLVDFQVALRLAEQQARELAIPQGRAQEAAYLVHTFGDIKGLVRDIRCTVLLMQVTRLNITRLHGRSKNERRGEARYLA